MGMKKIAFIASMPTGMSLAMEKEVKLKECNKSDEQKRFEAIQKLRTGLSEELIGEYILIKQKMSELSRAKRDDIVRKIQHYERIGVLTEQELALVTKIDLIAEE